MASIGQPLTQPETGWKRYDDTYPAIKYEGNWLKASNVNFYNGSRTYTNTATGKISFKFKGTSIRIIAPMTSEYSSNVAIAIDEIEEVYSQYKTGNNVEQTLVYEKTGLENKEHEVEIYFHSPGNFFGLDAIDIDEFGTLLHVDEVVDTEDLTIGKRIRAHYQAQSGQVGTFSNLGEEVYVDGIHDFIPPASSATPNGSFYFICVDDIGNRKILLADRAIQHSISWDKINEEGMTSTGQEVDYLVEGARFIVRLPSGGINASDLENDWQSMIIDSPLGNGDEIWNWSSLQSWTSTTNTYGSTQRTVRGWTSATTNSYQPTSNVSYARGFRPVLEIEHMPPPPAKISHYLIEDEGIVKTFELGEWQDLGSTLTDELFLTRGMEDLSMIPQEAWYQLSSEYDVVGYIPEVVEASEVRPLYIDHQEGTTIQGNLDISAIPHGQLIMQEKEYVSDSLIRKLEIDSYVSEEATLRMVMSINNGQTWHTFGSAGWEVINIDNLSEVKEKGITPEAFNLIEDDEWQALVKTQIRIAYYVELEDVDDTIELASITVSPVEMATSTPTLDSISLTYDELTIEGRLKELERINAINMAKLQFKTNALMKSDKYKMHDLVVDTFESNSLETLESKNHVARTLDWTLDVEEEEGSYYSIDFSSMKGKIFKIM